MNSDEEYKVTILLGALTSLVKRDRRVEAFEYLLGLAMMNGSEEAFRTVTKVYVLAKENGHL